MKKDSLKYVASSSGEYIHNKSSDDIFIDIGTCSKLYMRIIQSFNDLDLLEQLQPYCTDCSHRGNVIDENYFIENKLLITDLLHKLKCNQCGSKDVKVKLISNEEMPQLDRSNVVIFSDNLRTV